MNTNEILIKVRSVKLCLMAHPDNEQDSEFADRVSDMEEIETALRTPSPETLDTRQKITDILYQQLDVVSTVDELMELFSRSDTQGEDKVSHSDIEQVLVNICKGDINPIAPAVYYLKDYAGGTNEYIRTDVVYKAMKAVATPYHSAATQQQQDK